jgi:hypothetical protein
MPLSRNFLYHLALVVFSTGLVLGAGCEDSYVFPNEAPSNLRITKPSCYVRVGEEVPLSASATDDDGDPIYYRWTASTGRFEPANAEGQAVTWIAPDTPAPATITLIVTDEIEESRAHTTIEVGGDFPVDAVTNIPIHDAVGDSGYVYLLNLQPVEIPSGMTFTILEGVRMVARGVNSGFEVEGRLEIAGSEGSPVTMGPGNCVPAEGSWAGIAFRGTAAEGDISYLRAQFADIGILVRSGAVVVIRNSILSNNELYGLEVSIGGTATVTDCTLWENYTGILMVNGYLTMERSSVRYNRFAGVDLSAVNAGFKPPITHCNVSNNGERGISISSYIAPAIHYNAIYSNGSASAAYGLYLDAYQGEDSLYADENFWGLGYDSEETIPALIYDAVDAPLSNNAYVGFIPWLSAMPAEVPNP